MPTTVRLSKDEEKKIREKCIEINKLLIGANRIPCRESELVHKLLEISLRSVKVDEEGELYLE